MKTIDGDDVVVVGNNSTSYDYDHYCHCDPGWKGVYCEQLDLGPVHNGSGLQDMLIQSNISTWGGSVVYHDGKYHMVFSEILNKCGIHRWVSNSVVSHATSRGSIDNWKFTKTKTLWGVFAHEPIIVQDPANKEGGESFGLFLSYYPNGSATNSDTICQCQDGSSSSATTPDCIGEAGLGKNKSQFTYFTTSSSPEGPWSPLQSLENATPKGQRHVDLNFAPLLLLPNNNETPSSTSSLVAWTRWDIWTATNWKDPTTYKLQGQAPNWTNPNGNWEGEDPSMWIDRKGRYHILSHNGNRGKGGSSQLDPKGDCGRHLFSPTGQAGTWITAPLPLGGCAYPRVNIPFVEEKEKVVVVDGKDGTTKTTITTTTTTTRSFYRRERPHLIFNGEGLPVALSTSAFDTPIGPFSPDFKPPDDGKPIRDASYTMIQPVNYHGHRSKSKSK